MCGIIGIIGKAPVAIGADATIGAGSVITKDAPAGRLTVARGKQQVVEGWQRPVKKKPPKQEGSEREGGKQDGSRQDGSWQERGR